MTKKTIVSEDIPKDLGAIISKKFEAKGHDEFVIGLSGGSLPKFFAAAIPLMTSVDWTKVKFIFCDERLVPYDNPDSTWKVYKESIIGKADGLNEENFILVDTSLPSAKDSAKDYEEKVKIFAQRGFDLLLLGMGPDGHTCSLFPGHSLLKEETAIVAPITDSPKPPPSRVTLTLPFINRSNAVVFVSTGEGKKNMIENVLKKAIEDFPATLVRPKDGDLYWILDKPAASLL